MSRDRTKKIRIAFAVMIIILMVLFFVSFLLGRYSLSPKDVFCVLGNMIAGKAAPVGSNTEVILTKIRFPRIVMACLVGGALSAAGASFQGVFQNAMASPDVLGASSGASFGAALAILNNFGSSGIVLSAFIFSIITVLLTWLISEKGHGKKVLLLVLSSRYSGTRKHGFIRLQWDF